MASGFSGTTCGTRLAQDNVTRHRCPGSRSPKVVLLTTNRYRPSSARRSLMKTSGFSTSAAGRTLANALANRGAAALA